MADGNGKGKCPMCGRETARRFRPFCSRRCADIDLGRWFTGAYAVPAVEDPDGYDELDAPPGDAQSDPDILH